MNKTQLLTALASEREQTTALLAQIDDHIISTEAVFDDWTTKDLLGHLTAWEAELITALFKLQRGHRGRPRYYGLTQDKIDALSLQWRAESRERQLVTIINDFQGVRKQLIRQLDKFDNRKLNDPKRYNYWLKGKTLIDYIAYNAIDHEIEHRAQIANWWQARST